MEIDTPFLDSTGNDASLLVRLPDALVARVFSFVEFGVLAQCAGSVCVSWRSALYGNALLWTRLALPKYAVLLPYLPHNCVRRVVIAAPQPVGAKRKDAADSCRLLNNYGQHRIEHIVLEGHGIDTAIMEFLARIITPHLVHIQFHHVGLSFERKQFLAVLQRAQNVRSLRITRRPFKRATILSPLLSLFSHTLTHLRLDNLAAEQIPNFGAIVPNLVSLELDGLMELAYWAETRFNSTSITDDLADINDLTGAGNHVESIHNPPNQPSNNSADNMTIHSSSFQIIPQLRYLSCTNMDESDPDAVSKLMCFLLSKCPLLTHLVFSCPNYMMDLWPCVEFWLNIQHVHLDHCFIASDFVRGLQAGIGQLRDHHLATYGVYPAHVLQIKIGRSCQVEDPDLVRYVFGNDCFL
ncbi:hypothetical protein BDR26DRAFT_869386 [Obelidium mucronatum]|nr:hypothetical protein BDR26DRAFT_869386 [Obelidium mucronatum]